MKPIKIFFMIIATIFFFIAVVQNHPPTEGLFETILWGYLNLLAFWGWLDLFIRKEDSDNGGKK